MINFTDDKLFAQTDYRNNYIHDNAVMLFVDNTKGGKNEKMKQKEYIEHLDKTWGVEGFLGKLRDGSFDKGLYNELYALLLKIHFDDDEQIDRELIQLLWFIPIFMYRQKEYIDFPSKEYDSLRENVEEQLARIFGYP